MKYLKVELVFLCAIIVLSLVVGYFVLRSGSNTDTNNPPKFIQADFIDLKKIYSISKFLLAKMKSIKRISMYYVGIN